MTTRLTMLDAFDQGRLTTRYWLLFTLLMINTITEFFDFFIVGFLVTVVGPAWQLTFGETTVILLAAGLGQVLGAIPMAWAADRFGRRTLVLGCTCLYSIAAGLIGLVPDGNWLLFALLRFVVGVGYSGVVTSQLTLLVEFSPTRLRTSISNAAGAFAPIGVLLASMSVGFLLPALGWRYVAMLGALPLALAVLLYFVMPESVRWLVANERGEEARNIVNRYIILPSGEYELPTLPSAARAYSILDLYASPGRFWLIILMTLGLGMAAFGVTLWGPTFLALILGVAPAAAAKWFAWISVAGLAGRFLFVMIPARIGRWRSALICCWGSAAMLATAALFPNVFVGPMPLFFFCLVIGAIFYDGGYTNLLPYASELYPVQLAARGAALSYTVSGAAKLAGPVVLGLIAGVGTTLTPAAARAAITPGFMALAGFCVVGGLALLRFRYETHGKPMALDLPSD